MAKNTSNAKDLIVKLFKEKSCMKQDVFVKTLNVFEQFKIVLEELSNNLKNEVQCFNGKIQVEYKNKGIFEAIIKFAGDILVFHMHTNVFQFDKSHNVWKTSYIREDENRSFCGMINIYNFLSDSFKYNRMNDSGYLIARIFINKDLHFFVEGKRQLGFLYNDLSRTIIDKEKIISITESAVLYALDFDLLIPPYDNMKEVSVLEIKELEENMQIKTAKRLGFRFQADDDNFE